LYAALEILARDLERERQLAQLHLAQQTLQCAVVERHDILEDEHQVAHLLAELRIPRRETIDELLLERGVEEVENRRDSGRTAGRPHPRAERHAHLATQRRL